MNDRQQAAFSMGYRAALAGEHPLRAPYTTSEEAEAYNEGFYEACERIRDLVTDACE